MALLVQALVIAPPIVQCTNSTFLEDAQLSRLLSDLAQADPVFEESLRKDGGRQSGRVDVVSASTQPEEVQSVLDTAAEILRVHVFPCVLEGCQGQELWQRGVQELLAFKENYGHCIVPKMYSSSTGFQLGQWVMNQRTYKSRGKLSEEQIKQLEDLGFVWNVPDHRWQEGFNRLVDYKSVYGDVNVPQGYVTDDGHNLGVWANNQRIAMSKGKLSEEQIKQLEDLGFVWNVFDHQWQQGFDRLVAYKSVHGDVNVPVGHVTDDGYKLGSWVYEQRRSMSKGKLSEEQIKQLEDLGFVWNVPDHRWQEGFNRLVAYKSVHGDVNVPVGHVTDDGYKLGSWVYEQRRSMSKGKLSEEQIKQLEDLGFVWNVFDHQWQQGFDRLVAYKSVHGDVNVPVGHVTDDGYKLGSWVYEQRRSMSKGKLSEAKVKKLEGLGFKWKVRGGGRVTQRAKPRRRVLA